MAGAFNTLLSLAAAGTMMISGTINDAAPHNDVNGNLFLTNRQWRVSEDYVPPLEKANVPGQVKRMREDAVQAL
ncbi:MAG: hypothetical protein Q4C54_01635 [Clostridia bacterium]|nr:hypothetical protein [Clostridia bacterium]